VAFSEQMGSSVAGKARRKRWPELHPEADGATRSAIKKRFRDAFYTDTPAWKQSIVEQGLAAARQAVAGLAG
jgi:Protein of unknown function (DUF2817)